MKLRNLILYVIMFLFLINGLHADEETKKEESKEQKKSTPFFKAVLQDQGKIYSSPSRMKGKDFLLIGGIVAATGLMIAYDEEIYREIKKFQERNDWVDDVSPVITDLGLGGWSLTIAGGFYLGGLLLKDKKAKETARLTLMTFFHTGLVVQLGKHLTGRQRPSWDPGKDYWHGPKGFFKRYKKNKLSCYDAFPSGHTITIFGTATVIAEMYKNKVWVPILCYSVATLTGLSRITEDTHWISDVFVGAILGYAIGKFIVKKRNRLRKVNVLPVANSHQIGLNLSYEF
jgi:membrane-associated phospholipid phosphatase